MLGALPECHAARRGAQDTRGVHGVHAVPVDFLRAQIDAVLGDIGADAVKTGMLPSVEVRPACVHPGGLAAACWCCDAWAGSTGMPQCCAHYLGGLLGAAMLPSASAPSAALVTSRQVDCVLVFRRTITQSRSLPD